MFDPSEYERAARIAVAAVSGYVARSQAGEGPAVSAPPLAEVSEELGLRRLIREGGLDVGSFEPWLAAVLERTTRLHHPGELAHQVAAPDVPSAVADLIHGVINQPVSIYEMGAATGAMEAAIVEWMTERIGWDAEAGGVLTHGGSLANLTGLLAARAAAAPDAWREGVDGTLAVLAPPSAHYSVRRSVAMLGLGERSVIALDVDRYERIVPGALEAALERTPGRPAYGRWRSRRRPAPPAPGSTTTSRRSAASAPSTASGSMSTPRMVPRRCSQTPTATS
jgi:L-2,4-diaminobutyrate decarboxylase